jgi:Protein of unknown function (DUF2723)
MCPTISSGDSAELITNSFQLGLMHPPGYPLYTLIAKLFTYIPFNSIAWRVNLFSVITMALSVSFLFLTLNLVIKRCLVSLLLALLYGFSPLIWRYALVSEVFALNQLLLSVFMYLCLQLSNTKLPKYFVLMSLVAGLALAHHHTFIFVALPLFIWAILFLKRKIDFLVMLKAGTMFSIGLSPYALLFIFGNRTTLLSWGQIQNFADLLHHLLRLDYGLLSLGPNHEGSYFLKNIIEFIFTIQSGSLFVLLPLLFISGLSRLKNFNWLSPFFWILVSALGYITVFHFLAKINIEDPIYLSVLQRFWLLPFFLLFILTAPSFEFLYKTVFTKYKNRIPVAILSILVIVQLAINYKKNDQSGNWLYRDFARILLSGVDKDAILLVYGDLDVFTATYMQTCEGLRPDVKIVSLSRLSYSWYPIILENNYPDLNFKMQGTPIDQRDFMFISENISRHSIFTGVSYPAMSELWRKDYYELPVGFVNKLVAVGTIPTVTEYFQKYGSIWGDYSWLDPAIDQTSDWDIHIIQRFYNSEYRRLEFIMKNYQNIDAVHKNDLKLRLGLLMKYYQEDAKLIAWKSELFKESSGK